MKFLNTLKKIVINIAVTIFFIFALFMTLLLLNFNDFGVTVFGDTSVIIMKEDTKSEQYNKGDIVLVKKYNLDNINKGDEVFAYRIGNKGSVSVDLGVVGEIYPNDDSLAFENGASFSSEFIIGKAYKTFNKVGLYLSIIESKWGFLFIILVPGFIIFIYELYALIVEIKYGNEEE